MSMSGTKFTLQTCFRFANQRLAVGPDGKSNTPIIEFNLF